MTRALVRLIALGVLTTVGLFRLAEHWASDESATDVTA